LAIKISARHWGRAGLIGIALVAAVVVFAGAFALRILMGPLSLGPFTGELRASLDRVLPGLAVRFDDAALEWSPDEGRINLVILGARVFDENQRIIAQAPAAEIGLAAGPFVQGRIVIRRIALVGVQLTLVRTRDGVVRLGVEGERNQSDVLQRMRDAIAQSDRGGSSLKSFAVEKARLAFFEEQTGMFLVAPDANLQVDTGAGADGGPKGALRATVDARVEISGKPARVEAVMTIPAKGDDISGDVSISGLSLRSLGSNSKFFSFLLPFDLITDISGSFLLAHGTHIAFADFGIGAKGTVSGLGPPVHVKSFRVTGRYDGATGRLLIDDASLEGIQARAHLAGTGDLSFDPNGSLSKLSLDLRLDKIAVNMPAVMGKSVSLAHASLRGSYTPQTGTISIDQALVFGSALSANLAGNLVLAGNRSPSINMDGNIAQIDVRDLLHFWPLQTEPGARDWISTNVAAGRLGPVALHARIPIGALDVPALPESALSLTFPVSGATVFYIHGLPPLTGATGAAMLTGDTFKADLNSASVGPLAVSGGHVVIPNLHIHGTQGNIAAHIEGEVADVLSVIDLKPLQYPTRFHIRTATAKGRASVDLAVRVPMLHDVRTDDIGVSVRAVSTGLGLALNDHTTVSNGNVDFTIDNSSLHATGSVSLGSANLGIDWMEAFKARGAVTTRLHVNGILDDAARSELGFHGEEYLTGLVGVTGELDGIRGKIQHADLKLDLTQAALTFNAIGYKKPAGTNAQAQASVSVDDGGNVRVADIAVSGAALSAHATVQFDPDGALQSLAVPSFRAGAADDFSLTLTQSPVQGTEATIIGHSFDGAYLLRRDVDTESAGPDKKPEQPASPYHVNAKFDRFVMRNDVVLSPFALDIAGAGNKPRSMSLDGALSKTAQLTGSITSGENGRHVTLAAGDTGLLLNGVFGFTSLKGGTLNIDAAMPGIGAKDDPAEPDYSGTLVVSDFTIVNQPFLTRLFSAGSFGGLADLMRGHGIVIDKMQVPFTMHAGALTIREARASGPSVGITADGYYDLRTNRIALQGALAPLFGINSVLGVIPVLGNVFVSRKGEGMFGMTYDVTGNGDQPNLSVNPLSALAPGILRRIFQGATPSAPLPQANTTAPVPPEKPQ
jgi:hypothetical protein